jgi:hypothetical protein
MTPPKKNPNNPETGCNCTWSEWHKAQTAKAQAELATANAYLRTADEEITKLRHQRDAAPTHRKTPIPRLKPGQIQRYIGAVARAVSESQITAAQGNGLLYAAQTMISVLRATQPPPPPPPPARFKPPPNRGS